MNRPLQYSTDYRREQYNIAKTAGLSRADYRDAIKTLNKAEMKYRKAKALKEKKEAIAEQERQVRASALASRRLEEEKNKKRIANAKRRERTLAGREALITINADKDNRVVQTRGKNNKRLKNPKELRAWTESGAFVSSKTMYRDVGESMKAFKKRVELATQEQINNLNRNMYDVAGGGDNDTETYISYSNAKTTIDFRGTTRNDGMTRAKPYTYEYQAFTSIVDDGNCVPESLAKLYPKIGLERIQNDMGGAGAKTCEQVLDWCKKYDITCIGCDDQFNVVVEYYSKSRNRNPLYFVEKDNHFYLMDKSKGISIANSRSNSNKAPKKVKDNDKIEHTIVYIIDRTDINFMAEYTHYVVNNASDIKYYLFKYIEEYHSIPNVQFSALNRNTVFIKSFNFGNKSKMTINKNMNLLNDINTKLKSDESSLRAIVDILLKSIELPTSFLNKTTFKVFTEWKQRQHYAHLMSPKEWNAVPGIEQTWDANKQYTSALVNMPCDWLVFNMFALPQPYSGDVKDAYYYIETSNTMPCKGNGWYSRIILQWLIDNKEEFVVKYEILGSTISRDTFKPFVEKAMKLTPNFKYITNTLCGSLNTHSVKTAKGYISANKNDIIGRCMSSDAHLVQLSSEVFACASIEVQVKNNTNMPMYAQILDYASIMLADTITHLKTKGCIIRGYNTDSVTFKYPTVLPIDISTAKIGGWKTEEPKPFDYKLEPVCNKKTYEFEEPSWISELTEDDFSDTDAIVNHIIDKNESVSLDGQAGYGKSYLLELLIKKVEPENCVVLGYTNISANNVGGKTFHNTFKIDCITGLEKFDVKTVLNGKKWLIIDEKSQVPSQLYRICQTATEMNIPIIMAGDFAQILPVNDNGKADIFIKLICKNLITLTKYKRGDAELLERLTDVRNRVCISGFDMIEKGRLHFCFTKKQRDFINNREMNKVKSNYMTMPKNSNIPKVYIDMPLRACETKQNGDWLNNERWTVVNMFKDSIQITNKVKNMNIPIHVFIQSFVPGYAMTIHSSQGLTITEPYTIWIEKYHAFSEEDVWRLTYTALSRATKKEQIGIIRL